MQPYQMNPVNDFYFRNAQQAYTQPYVQFPPPHQPQAPQINCRFVTSIDEAKAAMIEPLSYNIFADTNTGKLYLKKLGNNGLSEFLCYSIEESVQEPKEDLFAEVNKKLSNIERILGGLNESVSNAKQPDGGTPAAVAEQNEPMMKQNPQAYQKMQEMVSGKSEGDLRQTAMNLAKERGIDIKQFASNFGIQL